MCAEGAVAVEFGREAAQTHGPSPWSRSSPRIVPRLATFDIPTTSPAAVVWTLNIRPKGNLIGSDTGTFRGADGVDTRHDPRESSSGRPWRREVVLGSPDEPVRRRCGGR